MINADLTGFVMFFNMYFVCLAFGSVYVALWLSTKRSAILRLIVGASQLCMTGIVINHLYDEMSGFVLASYDEPLSISLMSICILGVPGLLGLYTGTNMVSHISTQVANPE